MRRLLPHLNLVSWSFSENSNYLSKLSIVCVGKDEVVWSSDICLLGPNGDKSMWNMFVLFSSPKYWDMAAQNCSGYKRACLSTRKQQHHEAAFSLFHSIMLHMWLSPSCSDSGCYHSSCHFSIPGRMKKEDIFPGSHVFKNSFDGQLTKDVCLFITTHSHISGRLKNWVVLLSRSYRRGGGYETSHPLCLQHKIKHIFVFL